MDAELTIPSRSSVPEALQEFGERRRTRPFPLYDHIVGVVEELVRFTLLLRGPAAHPTDRCSECKTAAPTNPAAELAAQAVG